MPNFPSKSSPTQAPQALPLAQEVARPRLSRPNVLLMGPAGTGKTFSTRSIRLPQTFMLATEPGVHEVLGAGRDNRPSVLCSDGGEMHLREVLPATVGFDELFDVVKLVNTRSLEALQKMHDLNKGKYTQFIEFCGQLHRPVCQLCDTEFPPLDEWPRDSSLVIDGLSGLSRMAMLNAAGSKPSRSPANYGTAMDQLEMTIYMLANSFRGLFVLIAHVEREYNEVTGGEVLMPATLGKKLAPKLAPMFSDVIMARREGKSFYWSTVSYGADVKTRNLEMGDKLAPDFGPLTP